MNMFPPQRIPIAASAVAVAALAMLPFAATLNAQSFSLKAGDPSLTGPPFEDDILTAGPVITVAGVGAAGTEVDALSFGRISAFDAGIPVEFSVAVGSGGVPLSAVALEAAGAAGGAGDEPADIFVEAAGSNILLDDGDGIANPGVAPGLGLVEPASAPPFDDIDGWDNQGGPGLGFVWFSFSGATAGGMGVSGADLWVGAPGIGGYDLGVPPPLFATSVELGLVAGDEIDAMVIYEDSVAVGGLATAGDMVLFSLATGSPSLGGALPGTSGADVFSVTGVVGGSAAAPGGPLLLHRASATLGLLAGDEVDAIDVVPEPTITALLGLVGLISLLRRRRR